MEFSSTRYLKLRCMVFMQIILLACFMNVSFAGTNACGKPEFDRTVDTGLYLWQNCGTGQWYLRASGGGISTPVGLRVEGSFQSDRPITSLTGFSLEPSDPTAQYPEPDFLDKRDVNNIEFRFRVWNDAQDGINFRLPDNSSVCLRLSMPKGIPLVVGKAEAKIDPPINLQTLDSGGACSSVVPPLLLLLLDEPSLEI